MENIFLIYSVGFFRKPSEYFDLDFESGNNNEDEYERHSSVISSCPKNLAAVDFEPMDIDSPTINTSFNGDRRQEEKEKLIDSLANQFLQQYQETQNKTDGGQENVTQDKAASLHLSSSETDHGNQSNEYNSLNRNAGDLNSSTHLVCHNNHVKNDNPNELNSVTKSSAVISVHSSSNRTTEPTNNADFNTWQYWRPPIQDIELDIDMQEGGTMANVHVRTKIHVPQHNNNVTYSSELNVNVELDKLRSQGHISIQKTEGNMEIESEELQFGDTLENVVSETEPQSSENKTAVAVVDGRVSGRNELLAYF